jgi:aminopeptidase YwaD
MAKVIHQTLARHDGIVAGEPWYQGDHMIFVQSQVPALAFISEQAGELFTHYTHTPRDAPEIVDCAKLAEVAMAVRELLLELAKVVVAE